MMSAVMPKYTFFIVSYVIVDILLAYAFLYLFW